ncbi:NUMOD4 motif-containing HNH endonuclease [Agromyces larvae]|uniref:NUMOD4 motif-containing HNH endonuclease n=1 Tax=Agromyces larvae TaxID=2929802 RepID=A0ABY4C364_9MICO|nr:NUMOD4 motif-containing HNH endonuclease [Agromyces larvae]UOE45905.1 NUMOD4 motif-containing HNH endonuclease [Agromyces larvae]
MGRVTEVWLPVQGYEGHYEVSDRGRVRSLDRYLTDVRGVVRIARGKVLSPATAARGRIVVNLHLDGVAKTHSVHRLVALAFLGAGSPGEVVRHLDDNPKNNVRENLEWGTESENMFDRVRNGIHHYARRSACVRGHAYTPSNTRMRGAARLCLECIRINNLERSRRRREARKAVAA